jgi:foldase protein PrsA
VLKKKRAVISIASLLILALLVGYFVYANATSYVAIINGEKITKAEYLFYLYSEKRVMEDNKSQEEIDALWNSKIDGVDAAEVVKQNALENAKKYKIQLFKAQEQGLFLNDNDYSSIENSIDTLLGQISGFEGTRKQAEKSFKEWFGISVNQYKDIIEKWNLGFKFALKEQQENIKVTEEELKEHYKENSQNFIKATADILLFYKRDVQSGYVMFSDEEIEEAEKKAEGAIEKIKDGERFISVAAEFADDTKVQLEENVEIKMGAYIEQEIIDWAVRSNVGDVGLIDTELGFNIVEVKNLTSFEDERDKVRNVVAAEKYEKLLDEWAKDPVYNLELNEKALNRIKVR